MQKLVSIVIPCFNAEKWLGEAIESCLQQTYLPIEIIIIDDGSTDNSLEIIQSYGKKVIWERISHQGGNYARNRGFELSQGSYIQYLDADDYLLPQKIQKQVEYLDRTGADVVYGDLIYQYHLPDQRVVLKQSSLFQQSCQDFLECLLAQGSICPAPYLLRRKVVVQSGGWDEVLKAAQDRDFLISISLTGAKVAYQADYESVYRRYGDVTVSTSNKARLVQNHYLVLQKAQRRLIELNRLSVLYRKALAYGYYSLAQNYKHHISPAFYLLLLLQAFLMFLNVFLRNVPIGWISFFCTNFACWRLILFYRLGMSDNLHQGSLNKSRD